jgi:Fms-interacting protein/Thoc5
MEKLEEIEQHILTLNGFVQEVRKSISSSDDLSNLNIEKLCPQSTLTLLHLHTANREALLEIEELKESVQKQKSIADTKHLLLQNLLYEKSFVQREISTLRNVDTNALDSLNIGSNLFVSHEMTDEDHTKNKSILNEMLQDRINLELAFEQKQVLLKTLRDQNAQLNTFLGELNTQVDKVKAETMNALTLFDKNTNTK